MERSELARELERLHAESWGWALACCGRDRELAEDALQTAYVRVLSGRARFGERSTLKTWLFGVIRLTAMEELRRLQRRRARDAGAEAARELVDPVPRADVFSDSAERIAALTEALAALSPRQQEVLHLVFYHDMTIEAAAAVMRISSGSARTHYDRGKKALAAKLGSETRR